MKKFLFHRYKGKSTIGKKKIKSLVSKGYVKVISFKKKANT